MGFSELRVSRRYGKLLKKVRVVEAYFPYNHCIDQSLVYAIRSHCPTALLIVTSVTLFALPSATLD